MRVGTARHADRLVPVIARDDGLYELAGDGRDLRELIAAGSEAIEAAAEQAAGPLEGAELAAPLRPPKIVAIGLNYLDHIREQGAERPEQPLVFAKFPSCVIGPGEPIPIDPEVTRRVDWEVELAVVVGEDISKASPEQAIAGVFGYTVANDVSARDLQRSDGQWVRAKSLDGFCPLGPTIVTADALGDPQALALKTTVNGETMQDSSTAEMLFGVAELLSFCSHSFRFEPGDVLLTGTPWGGGAFMDPRRFLGPGDEVEVSVERIGALRNPVVAAQP